MKKEREFIVTSLVIQDEPEKEHLMHVSRLDEGIRLSIEQIDEGFDNTEKSNQEIGESNLNLKKADEAREKALDELSRIVGLLDTEAL